ncbi:unnamed protein product [Orchesella dallaii]|uniref:CASP-like protein n=1 Tax=Orchesella dallaii TaxID=48710 RepID=A0ABP1QJ11_9HEXA
MGFKSTRSEVASDSPGYQLRNVLTRRLKCGFVWIPMLKIVTSLLSALIYLDQLAEASDGGKNYCKRFWNILFAFDADSLIVWGQIAFATASSIMVLMTGRRLICQEVYTCKLIRSCKNRYLELATNYNAAFAVVALFASQTSTASPVPIAIPPAIVEFYGAWYIWSTLQEIEELFPDSGRQWQ